MTGTYHDMLYAGVDPDLHDTAIAWLTPKREVVKIDIVRVPQKLKGLDAANAMAVALVQASLGPPIEPYETVILTVESQAYRSGASGGKRRANPEDLIPLATVAGAALARVLWSAMRRATSTLVLPEDWKGQRPKLVHQKEICKKLGWSYDEKRDFVVPHEEIVKRLEAHCNMIPADWKHALDAIGLALWRIEQDERAARLASY